MNKPATVICKYADICLNGTSEIISIAGRGADCAHAVPHGQYAYHWCRQGFQCWELYPYHGIAQCTIMADESGSFIELKDSCVDIGESNE